MEFKKDLDLRTLANTDDSADCPSLPPCILDICLSKIFDRDEEMFAQILDETDHFPENEICCRCNNLINCIKIDRYQHSSSWKIIKQKISSRHYKEIPVLKTIEEREREAAEIQIEIWVNKNK